MNNSNYELAFVQFIVTHSETRPRKMDYNATMKVAPISIIDRK